MDGVRSELLAVRGSSLVETILAVFILVIAVSFSALSFHRSMQYQGSIQRKAQSVAFSELVLDQVREWANDPAHFTGSWAGWASVSNSAYPGFEARITAIDQTLVAPATQLSLAVAPANRQLMTNSMKNLEVTIFYSGRTESQFQALIGEPERLAARVTVTPVVGIPDPLGRDSTVEFRASALDSAGNSIPDVFFQWTSNPLSGNGTVVATGRGQTANLVNAYQAIDGVTRYTGGQVSVRALCIVRGREVSGLSAPVNLQP